MHTLFRDGVVFRGALSSARSCPRCRAPRCRTRAAKAIDALVQRRNERIARAELCRRTRRYDRSRIRIAIFWSYDFLIESLRCAPSPASMGCVRVASCAAATRACVQRSQRVPALAGPLAATCVLPSRRPFLTRSARVAPAARPVVSAPAASCARCAASSGGTTRTTAAPTWAVSGRSRSPAARTPRASSWRRCARPTRRRRWQRTRRAAAGRHAWL